MTKQATMRTRNTKTPVKTPPPAKKGGPKTPVKSEPVEDKPVVVDLTTAIAVSAGTKSESNEIKKEQDVKAKITSPASAKKQKKGDAVKPLTKDDAASEEKAENESTEIVAEIVVEQDEEMEENGEDAGEDEDEQEGEDEEAEEAAEDEEGNENETEGEEEEDEDEEGEEAEGGAVAEEHQALKLSTERQRGKRLEIFVGGLEKEATEDDVKKVFESVGEVVEVRLRKNQQTGKNRGYAFVRFASADQAARACTELERTEIRGKACHVVPSEDNNVLFVGNLNKSWTKKQVEEKLQEYGIEGIEELTLMEDPQNEGKNRGFIFIELATHNDAVKTLKRLAKPDVFFGSDKSPKVEWAQQNEPDAAVMSQVKSVFVDGIPAEWDEDKMKEHFGKYGEIERIVLARNLSRRSKRKDFAFVDFVQRDAAVACIDALKDSEVVDGENKIKVKVKLAQPRPKSKATQPRPKTKAKAVNAKGVSKGGGSGESARPGRGGGISRGGLSSRRPARGGGGVRRGALGLKQRSTGDDRSLPIERSRGGLARLPRIPLTGGYSRQDDLRYTRGLRPTYDYRIRPSYDIQDDYPPPRGVFPRGLSSRRSSQSGRLPLLPRDDGYLRQTGVSYDYDRELGAGFSRVRAPGLGMKRAYSALDEDPSYYDGPRGYPRARIDYGDVAPSQYEPIMRAPVGHSAIGAVGRVPVPPLAGGPGTQPSLGLYDQSGGLGSSLGPTGASSLYGSGSTVYGSTTLSGVGDYIPSGMEVRGASLYAGSSGYNYPGAGGSVAYY